MNKLLQILKKYDYVVVFVVLVVLSLVLMARTSYYQSSRLVALGNGIAGDWYRGVNSVGSYFGLKAENDRLAAENAALRAQLAESYISYTDSVFVVNDTVYKQRYTYTEAQVMKNSWTQQNNYIMINKGSDHGVEPDMAVISPQGIVGIVVSTSPNFATVMPVLHSDSRNSVFTDINRRLIYIMNNINVFHTPLSSLNRRLSVFCTKQRLQRCTQHRTLQPLHSTH